MVLGRHRASAKTKTGLREGPIPQLSLTPSGVDSWFAGTGKGREIGSGQEPRTCANKNYFLGMCVTILSWGSNYLRFEAIRGAFLVWLAETGCQRGRGDNAEKGSPARENYYVARPAGVGGRAAPRGNTVINATVRKTASRNRSSGPTIQSDGVPPVHNASLLICMGKRGKKWGGIGGGRGSQNVVTPLVLCRYTVAGQK